MSSEQKVNKTAVFMPTSTYFTKDRALGDEYVLITALYTNAQVLYVYDNGALDKAARAGYDIWLLDTGAGAGAIREHIQREMLRLKKLGVEVDTLSFKGYLEMASLDCLDAMRSLYHKLELEWNNEWHLWPSAYWHLLTLPGMSHGKDFGMPRPA